MNRRGFLSLLGATAVVPLVPMPDLVLPTRTIFLPPRGGWITRTEITAADLAQINTYRSLAMHRLMVLLKRDIEQAVYESHHGYLLTGEFR